MDDTASTMTVSAETLRQAVKLISTITDEAIVRPSEDGWHMVSISQDHVALMDISIQSKDIDGFDPTQPPFGVKVEDLTRAMKAKGDKVTLSVEDSMLCITVGRTVQRLPLLVTLTDPPKVPQMSLDTQAMFPSGEVASLLDVCPPKATEIIFSVSQDEVELGVADQLNVGGTTLRIPKESCVWIDTSSADAVASRYPMEHVSSLFKSLPRDTPVTVALDKDYPMTVTGSVPGSSFRWMVAPRVVSE